MPRSKNPDKYPKVFKSLLLAAYAAGEKGITWGCPDKKTAQRTRMQLYAYTNAVAVEEEKHDLPEDMRDSKRFHQIQITVAWSGAGDVCHIKVFTVVLKV